MVGTFGDPAAMRASASMLRLRAETISELAARLDAQVAQTVFEGPAADAFRLSMTERRRAADALAAELLGASDRVLAAAAEVERQQLMGGA